MQLIEQKRLLKPLPSFARLIIDPLGHPILPGVKKILSNRPVFTFREWSRVILVSLRRAKTKRRSRTRKTRTLRKYSWKRWKRWLKCSNLLRALTCVIPRKNYPLSKEMPCQNSPWLRPNIMMILIETSQVMTPLSLPYVLVRTIWVAPKLILILWGATPLPTAAV